MCFCVAGTWGPKQKANFSLSCLLPAACLSSPKGGEEDDTGSTKQGGACGSYSTSLTVIHTVHHYLAYRRREIITVRGQSYVFLLPKY